MEILVSKRVSNAGMKISVNTKWKQYCASLILRKRNSNDWIRKKEDSDGNGAICVQKSRKEIYVEQRAV